MEFLPDFSWLLTRNSHEAAALNALKIGVKPVTMRKNTSAAKDITEWTLKPASDDGRYNTSELRKSFNTGKPQGLLATETLHPYLVALRVFHNRNHLLDAQKGRSMRSVEAAPGSWILEPGHCTPAELSGLYLETYDQDRALGLIGNGSAIISITGPEGSRLYRLTRLALPSKLLSGTPRVDNGIWWLRHQNHQVFPEHADSHFGQQIHALHCLRELRKHQYSERFIVVPTKTPLYKGAAVNEKSGSDVFGKVQKTMGVRL